LARLGCGPAGDSNQAEESGLKPIAIFYARFSRSTR
jgi:hypothetical protein